MNEDLTYDDELTRSAVSITITSTIAKLAKEHFGEVSWVSSIPFFVISV